MEMKSQKDLTNYNMLRMNKVFVVRYGRRMWSRNECGKELLVSQQGLGFQSFTNAIRKS